MLQDAISDILVFKTNVMTQDDRQKVAALFHSLSGIKSWNIDFNDIDHVLRIEKLDLEAADIIAVVREAGFECEELPD